LPFRCDGDTQQPRWRLSGSVSAVSTQLDLGGDLVRVEQVTVGASAGYFPTWRGGYTLSLGGLVAGRIEGRELGPGVQLALGASYLAKRERSHQRWPFVLLTGSLAGAFADGVADDGDHHYLALDGRVGVAVGKSLAKGRYTGYLAARAFGGPVMWRRGGEDVSGGDRYHVTVGAGATFRVPGVLDLGIELMPLGERSVTASVTIHR
jgi:hypothetical protein